MERHAKKRIHFPFLFLFSKYINLMNEKSDEKLSKQKEEREFLKIYCHGISATVSIHTHINNYPT